jgi:hypothetical protein
VLSWLEECGVCWDCEDESWYEFHLFMYSSADFSPPLALPAVFCDWGFGDCATRSVDLFDFSPLLLGPAHRFCISRVRLGGICDRDDR